MRPRKPYPEKMIQYETRKEQIEKTQRRTNLVQIFPMKFRQVVDIHDLSGWVVAPRVQMQAATPAANIGLHRWSATSQMNGIGNRGTRIYAFAALLLLTCRRSVVLTSEWRPRSSVACRKHPFWVGGSDGNPVPAHVSSTAVGPACGRHFTTSVEIGRRRNPKTENRSAQ